MKKILFVILALSSMFFTVFGVDLSAKSKDDFDSFANNYFNILKEVESKWQGTKIKEVDKVFVNNTGDKANIYRVFKNKTQQGYFIVMNYNDKVQVVEATYEGIDPVKENKNLKYYIPPFGFYTKKDFNKQLEVIKELEEKEQAIEIEPIFTTFIRWPWNDPTDSKWLVPVPSRLIYTYSISNYSIQKVLETPEYFDHPYGPMINSSGPTTAAMLTSFFDRHALSNLISGTLPLSHYDNKSQVDNHVITMAKYLKTCNSTSGDLKDPKNCSGTYYTDAFNGLEKYFSDKGYSSYYGYFRTSLAEYSKLIMAGNPVYLRLFFNHVVLGIGKVTTYGSTPQLIVRYTWESRSGEYLVSQDLFDGFVFVSRG